MLKEQSCRQTSKFTGNPQPDTAQEAVQALWEEHIGVQFDTHNTEDTLATMVEDAYVNHIPVMTGGVGKPALRGFIQYFIPQIADLELVPISRIGGTDQLVDEMVAKFTPTIQMDWRCSTGKRVEVPVVAIIRFRDGKLAHEHIYWDQASVLVQVGLLDLGTLPVVGVDGARKAIVPTYPQTH